MISSFFLPKLNKTEQEKTERKEENNQENYFTIVPNLVGKKNWCTRFIVGNVK